jgi:Type ISP C-terminal specificity domain
MTSPLLTDLSTTFPTVGSDEVEKLDFDINPDNNIGRVFINAEQYFGNVPEIAWKFWIGGYQPAQKWLKDRKGRKLSSVDIEHYQKIINVLVKTHDIMQMLN